jgi:Synergist-CTERM protein sorting domain-containing protein
MTTPPRTDPPMADEQLRYARWLDWSAKVGLAALIIGFGAYATGLLPAQVPFDRMPELLALPLDRYLAATGTPTGWGWTTLLAKGEFASLIGIAVLAGCSALCLLAIIPLYLRRRDAVYAVACILEIAVLVLAASGVLTAGH